MQTVTVKVINEAGLHARPAGLLVNLAKNFECDIQLYKNGNSETKNKSKSIISVMALAARQGDQLTFEASGVDEKEAIIAIEEFVKNGCRE